MKSKKKLMCEKHDFEKLYFCSEESCQLALCPECYFEEHLGHPKKKLKDVYEKRKRVLDDKMEALDKTLSKL